MKVGRGAGESKREGERGEEEAWAWPIRRRAEKKWNLSKKPELEGSTRSQICERAERERLEERKRGLMEEAGMAGEEGEEREEKRKEKRDDSEGENICVWRGGGEEKKTGGRNKRWVMSGWLVMVSNR